MADSLSVIPCNGQECTDTELSFLLEVAANFGQDDELVVSGVTLAKEVLAAGSCHGTEPDIASGDYQPTCSNTNAGPAISILKAVLQSTPEPVMNSLATAARVNIASQEQSMAGGWAKYD